MLQDSTNSWKAFSASCWLWKEKAMATHSSSLAWKIPWTEEPGRLQSMGSLRVRHDWVTSLSLLCIGEGNGNPLQCSCLENPRDRGAWWAAVYGVHRVRHDWCDLAAAAADCGSIFLAKSCQDTWRSGSQLVRDQVNMTDEAKLHSPIYSTFEALVVWCAVGHCHGEELGPFYWSLLVADVAVFGTSHQFAEHTSQMWWLCWDSESCNGSDRQQITNQWPWSFFWCKFGFGNCFGASSWSNHWADCANLLFVSMSQSHWEMVHCCCINKRWHFKMTIFFLFVVSSWGLHL